MPFCFVFIADVVVVDDVDVLFDHCSVMRRSVRMDGKKLKIENAEFDVSKYDRIYVVGGGKAAADMAEELESK